VTALSALCGLLVVGGIVFAVTAWGLVPIADRESVVVEPSDELRVYVASLVERSQAVRDRRVAPEADNMLKITGDGRKAALDLRLVAQRPDPAGGKIAAAAERIAAIYHRTRDNTYVEGDGRVAGRPGSLQLVFCDLGTPAPDRWNVYEHLKALGPVQRRAHRPRRRRHVATGRRTVRPDLTDEMLDILRQATPAAGRIGTVVNTHANGDHCYGCALVAGAEIVALAACAAEMADLPPSVLAAFMRAAADMGDSGLFLLDIFGSFHFDGIELAVPTRTFTGELDLQVGDRPVRLIEVGPAHTAGDVVVLVPDASVVFTGDILFHGSHPIVWAGPVTNWIAACERLLAVPGVETVVPGHGPVTGLGAVADLKGYFEHLTTEALPRLGLQERGVDRVATNPVPS
jgi:glyoxylase-like metal-dependent hydrolase (beta-lactamase superfamily II)